MNTLLAMKPQKRAQSGVFLIEALIAILIFSLGILGMVAMGGSAIAAQSDAQYRTEAANFATEMASAIMLGVDRSTPAAVGPSLDTFAHRPVTGGAFCTFAGAASTNPLVSGTDAWVDKVSGGVAGVQGLPGATNTSQSINVIRTGAGTGFNRVEITVCWQPPATVSSQWHRHQLVTYIPQ